MSEVDFIKCMKVLHACYLKDFDEDTLMVWYSQLKDIDYQTMMNAIRKFSRETKYMPSISDLRKECEIIKSRGNEVDVEKVKIKCMFCDKWGFPVEIRSHQDRHLSVEYIKSRMKKHFGKELTKQQIEEFMNLRQDIFDEWYDNFLEELIPLTVGEEHDRLIKIKETRPIKSVDK